MELECEGTISAANATEADIRNAFADDAGRGEFLILSQAPDVYMQAAGEGDGPYALEYRQGNGDQHFHTTDEPTKAQVQSAFLKYLTNDPTWQQDFHWKKLELNAWPKFPSFENAPKKPWWKFW